jgi:hypothetical protein
LHRDHANIGDDRACLFWGVWQRGELILKGRSGIPRQMHGGSYNSKVDYGVQSKGLIVKHVIPEPEINGMQTRANLVFDIREIKSENRDKLKGAVLSGLSRRERNKRY